MRKILIFMLMILFFTLVYSITIYPLVNRLEVLPNQKEVEVVIKVANSSSEIANVEVSFSDFVIEGTQYLYDVPGYEFSIKDWMSSESTNLILQPGQSIDFPITINIPSSFKGAQAFGAIHFKQRGRTTGVFETVFDYISLIILDFPVSKNIKTDVLDVNVYDLTSTASTTLKEKYGDFGTVIDLKLSNDGNAVLALNGELRLISREINRIITSIPISNNNFVVFPNRECNFEFFVPFVFPKGNFEVQVEGFSQGIKVTALKKLKILKESTDKLAIMINPKIVLINVKRTIENSKINIQNLSPKFLELSLNASSSGITIFPKTIKLSPYSKINGFVKFDSRNEKLKDGDNIFKINSSDSDVILYNEPVIVLRYGELIPNCDSYVTNVATDTFNLNVVNTGNTILNFKIIKKDKLQEETLNDEIILYPGKEISLDIKLPYNEVIKNSTFILYKIYGEDTYDHTKNIGDVRK